MDQAIPTDVQQRPIHGIGLDGTTFGDHVRGDPTLLVFLRHLG